jgi:hypothetical protein
MVYKKHKTALKAAKEIFGSIVKCAYVGVEPFPDESQQHVRDRLKFSVDYGVTTKDNKIRLASPVMLEFSNGKQVIFNVSEEGSIYAEKVC